MNVTVAPGAYTHLIECEGELLGYSTITGNLVKLRIESNSRITQTGN